jgi:hypothetical protein
MAVVYGEARVSATDMIVSTPVNWRCTARCTHHCCVIAEGIS